VEAGFVAVGQGEARSPGAGVKTIGHAPDGIGTGEWIDGRIDGAGFDGPGAPQTPRRSGHFFDDAKLQAIGGLEALDVKIEQFLKSLGGLGIEDQTAGQKAVA
jgi:hypothetical protein